MFTLVVLLTHNKQVIDIHFDFSFAYTIQDNNLSGYF